ncbi:MAG: hypothetical protein C0463_07165 [Idiomarina sp.]|nr:hypothetical protein [Idiomarina sp.]
MLDIPDRENLLRRGLLPAVLVSGFILLLVLAFFSWKTLTASSAYEIHVSEADIGHVEVRVSAFGRLLPRQTSSIISEVDGTVVHISRYPGSELTEGESIVTLRNPLLEREKERAQLSVMEAMAGWESAKAQLQRESIQLDNDVEIQQYEVRFAERELETMEVLIEQQIIAQLDFLRAQTSVEQAHLKLNLARRNIEAFSQYRDAEEQAYRYRLEQAEKLLAMAENDIEQLDIKATRSGLLNELSEDIEPGTPIQRGQVIAQITDPLSLYADLLISASDAAQVQVGQAALINVRGQRVRGEVLRIHPSAQNNQVRLEVVFVDGLPDSSRPNLEVTSQITTAESKDVVRIRTPTYVTQKHSTGYIFVRIGEGFERREAVFGVVGNDYVEVVSGIEAGDQVLLNIPATMATRNFVTNRELTNE